MWKLLLMWELLMWNSTVHILHSDKKKPFSFSFFLCVRGKCKEVNPWAFLSTEPLLQDCLYGSKWMMKMILMHLMSGWEVQKWDQRTASAKNTCLSSMWCFCVWENVYEKRRSGEERSHFSISWAHEIQEKTPKDHLSFFHLNFSLLSKRENSF